MVHQPLIEPKVMGSGNLLTRGCNGKNHKINAVLLAIRQLGRQKENIFSNSWCLCNSIDNGYQNGKPLMGRLMAKVSDHGRDEWKW